jgi:hypothetical protein
MIGEIAKQKLDQVLIRRFSGSPENKLSQGSLRTFCAAWGWVGDLPGYPNLMAQQESFWTGFF